MVRDKRLQKKERHEIGHLFCVHPFFLFLPFPPHPAPGNFLPQNPLFLGPQIYSFE